MGASILQQDDLGVSASEELTAPALTSALVVVTGGWSTKQSAPTWDSTALTLAVEYSAAGNDRTYGQIFYLLDPDIITADLDRAGVGVDDGARAYWLTGTKNGDFVEDTDGAYVTGGGVSKTLDSTDEGLLLIGGGIQTGTCADRGTGATVHDGCIDHGSETSYYGHASGDDAGVTLGYNGGEVRHSIAIISINGLPTVDGPTFDAVSFDSIDQDTPVTKTIEHVNSASIDGVMLAGVNNRWGTGAYVDGVTFNGDSMTQFDTGSYNGMVWRWYYLVAPDIGTHDVVWTFNTGAPDNHNWNFIHVTYFGVNQSDPVGTATDNSSTTGASTNITVPIGGIGVGLGIVFDNSTLTYPVPSGSEVTRAETMSAASNGQAMALFEQIATGTVTFAIDDTEDDETIVAVPLNPADLTIEADTVTLASSVPPSTVKAIPPVEYLGTSGWQTSGATPTPPATANYFVFGLMGNASGSTGAQWTSVTWNGYTDAPQAATAINFSKKTTTNSVFSALWELLDPDVSGVGTVSMVTGGRIVIMYFRYTDIINPTYSETTDTGTPDNYTIDPGWLSHGIKTCVVAHNGLSEAPASGFTEVASYAGAAGHSAIGYRADDGYVGWNVENSGTRAAYCASCISPNVGALAALSTLTMASSVLSSTLLPGAVTPDMDTLTLASAPQNINLAPGAIASIMDALTMASTASNIDPFAMPNVFERNFVRPRSRGFINTPISETTKQ